MVNLMNDIVAKENQPTFIDRLLAQRNLYSGAKLLSVILFVLCILVPIGLSFAKYSYPCINILPKMVVVYGVAATIIRIILKDATESYQGFAARVQQQFDTELFDIPWNTPLCGSKPLPEEIYKYSRKGDRTSLSNWYDEIVATLPKSVGSLVCMRTNVVYDKGLRNKFFSGCVVVFFVAVTLVIVWGLANNTGLWDAFLYGMLPLMPIVTWFIDVWKQHVKSMKVLDNLYSLIISALDGARGGVDVPKDTLTEIQNFMFLHRKSSYLIPDCIYRMLRSESEAEAYYGARKICEQYNLQSGVHPNMSLT